MFETAVVGAAIGAALGAIDAAINGRNIAKGALQGAIGGAIAGAITGGIGFGFESGFFAPALQPVVKVVGLGLSTYSVVTSAQDGNYATAAFSAVIAFQSASEIFSGNQSQNSNTSADQSSQQLDASPASSVSGSGNEKVELKTRDIIKSALKPGAPEPTQQGMLSRAPANFDPNNGVALPDPIGDALIGAVATGGASLGKGLISAAKTGPRWFKANFLSISSNGPGHLNVTVFGNLKYVARPQASRFISKLTGAPYKKSIKWGDTHLVDW